MDTSEKGGGGPPDLAGVPGSERGDHESESDGDIYRDYDEDVLIGIQRTQAIALTAIVCISFLGNAFVLCSLSLAKYSSRPSRRVLKQLLSHLCVGDLAYAILTILPRTVNILTFPRFYGGHFVCRMVKFLQLVPVYVCPFLTVTVIIERYANMRQRTKTEVATIDPSSAMMMANRRRADSWRENRAFAHVLSFWAWLSALVLSAPNILAFRYEFLDEAGTIGACVYQVREAYERLWMTFLTFATWVIPFVIVLVLGGLMFVRYYARGRRGGGDRKGSTVEMRLRQRTEDGENLRVLRFLMVVILSKFILWTPFNIVNIVGSHWRSIQIDENISVAVTLASNCSCCVPAIAYAFFDHSQIRETILGQVSKWSSRSTTTSPSRRESSLTACNNNNNSNHHDPGAAASLINDDRDSILQIHPQSSKQPRVSMTDKVVITFTI